MTSIFPSQVSEKFKSIQKNIIETIESIEPSKSFDKQTFIPETETLGISFPATLEKGTIIEKAAVNFTHSIGDKLPEFAVIKKKHLKDLPFEAVSLSIIIHPNNPHIPTSHCNARFFFIKNDLNNPYWHFGGGFDLTPYIPYEEDTLYWHRQAKNFVSDYYSEDIYTKMRNDCANYFHLTHRNEPRGVGGIFFDDLTNNFETSFDFSSNLLTHYINVYIDIIKKRMSTPFSLEDKNFQSYRRSRYVEFNLLQDRGTLYGINTNRRVESVLSSLPPTASWPAKLEEDMSIKNTNLVEFFTQHSSILKSKT